MSENTPTTPVDQAGHIHNLGMLDLSTAQDAGALAHIRRIENVGVVLIPENLTAQFGAISQSNVGLVLPVPTGKQVKTLSGQLSFPGDAFAEGDPEHPVLLLVGQIVFTSRITTLGYTQVIVAGQLIAPEGSESAVARYVTRLIGQAVYYPGTAKPRILRGQETLDEAYFQALAEPQVLILLGSYKFAANVTVETLRQKVAGLIVLGELQTAPGLVSAVRAMASDVMGVLKAY